MSVFQAVWPVVDLGMSFNELKAEAVEDLPKVARRHGRITVGEPLVQVKQGAEVPGFTHAELVVVATSETAHVPPRLLTKPQESFPCGRCGRERQGKYGDVREFCADCRPFAVADGWVA